MPQLCGNWLESLSAVPALPAACLVHQSDLVWVRGETTTEPAPPQHDIYRQDQERTKLELHVETGLCGDACSANSLFQASGVSIDRDCPGTICDSERRSPLQHYRWVKLTSCVEPHDNLF